MLTFADDKAMQVKWNAFVKKIDVKTYDFRQVLNTIKAFLFTPFTAYVNKSNYSKTWVAVNLSWEE